MAGMISAEVGGSEHAEKRKKDDDLSKEGTDEPALKGRRVAPGESSPTSDGQTATAADHEGQSREEGQAMATPAESRGGNVDVEDIRRNMQSSIAALSAKILAKAQDADDGVSQGTLSTVGPCTEIASSGSASSAAGVNQAGPSEVPTACGMSPWAPPGGGLAAMAAGAGVREATVANIFAGGCPWGVVGASPPAVEPTVEQPAPKKPIEDRLHQKSDKFAAAWKNAETYAAQLKSGKYLKPDGAVGIARGPKGSSRPRGPSVPSVGAMGSLVPGLGMASAVPGSMGTGVAGLGVPGAGVPSMVAAGMGMGVPAMGLPVLAAMGMPPMGVGAAGMLGLGAAGMGWHAGMGSLGMGTMGTLGTAEAGGLGVGAGGIGAGGIVPAGMGATSAGMGGSWASPSGLNPWAPHLFAPRG